MERSPEAVLKVIREFIIREKGSLNQAIELDTQLLDGGMIDSFGLIELGEEIGQAFELPLFSGNLLPEDFESPRTLWNRIQEVLAS